MVVNPSRHSQKSGNQHEQCTPGETSSTGTSTITPSCRRSPGGQGYSSGWTRRPIIATQRGIQLCIARSPAMQTSGASTLANTYSPNSKISLNKSGANCLKRYHLVGISDSKAIAVDISVTQTKTIWLKFFGSTLHANRALARISLRASLGEEPTEAQLVAKWEAIKPAGVRKPLAAKLQNNIRRAFNRGEEVLSSVLSSTPQEMLMNCWVRHAANSRLGNEMRFIRLRLRKRLGN